MTFTHSICTTCQTLKELGGPDVEKEALEFVKNHVEVRDDATIVGEYGTHSDCTKEVAQWYDEKGVVTDYKTGEKAKELWVCGHFVGKALYPLMKDFESISDCEDVKYMLWMTKSAVQPRGPKDEWTSFQTMNDTVKQWADEGKAHCPTYRPGIFHHVVPPRIIVQS